MSSGALKPAKAATWTYQNGLDRLDEPAHLILLKNVYGGLLLSAAGLLYNIATARTPSLATRLLQGLTFPIGLVCIYFVVAELFTITLLQRRGKPLQYVRGFVLSWAGNLLGALFFAFVFAYAPEAVTEEPYRSGIISQVTTDIVNLAWYCISCGPSVADFSSRLRCPWGRTTMTAFQKLLDCTYPFFISVAVRFPHTVEYMYLISLGMMHGAKLSVGGFLWRAMLPISLGNTVGGAVFMGLYEWWVFLHCRSKGKKMVTFADYTRLHW